MPPRKLGVLWEAPPHTIAKVAILERYLQAWFPIFGRVRGGYGLLYIDGFAGPGRYINHPDGSPVVALRSASKALSAIGPDWTAGDVHCAFIERHRRRFAHLEQHLEPFRGKHRLNTHLYRSSFVEGITKLKQDLPEAFTGTWPLFAFIDPFGATGAPFDIVADLLSRPRSEVLVNFDADSVSRIFRAGDSADHKRILNEIYGDDSWTDIFSDNASFHEQCRAALALYKRRLRSLEKVRYVFSFEMTKTGSTPDYFLIFASQHPTGLEKMKEAMKKMDQTGEYRFSDAHIGRQTLFRFDRPDDFAPRLFEHFAGQHASYSDLRDYALNETPFVNPKSMLRILEMETNSRITVHGRNPKSRRGTYADEDMLSFTFRKELFDG